MNAATYGVLSHPTLGPELLRLVDAGVVYSLSHRIDATTPHAATTSPFSMRPRRSHDEAFEEGPFREATEILEMSSHMATHVEALCHVAEALDGVPVVYDDVPSAELHGDAGFRELGIERCPPIISRGLLLDIPALKGVDVLEDSYGITSADLEACADESGLVIQAGDAVLIRTGFSRFRDTDPARFVTVGPGPTPEACRWLADRGIGLTGSDTMSFEQVPSPHIGHLELIRRRGVSIVKQADLEGIARDGVRQFLFIALPLKIVGATASPVNPIAIS